jgi:glucan-binding YG repeat protein/lysophospholipase L1-like esterase
LSTVPTQAASSSQLIIINKKTNTLAFYDSGKLVKTFSVATGRTKDQTPEGKFRIVTKIKNRPYYTGHIPGGDPRNPLGDRWMGLETRGTYGDTYGIHGTKNENSIGKYITQGCVRMHNDEIRWLYDQVQLYTNVVITTSDSSFDEIAKANGYSINSWVLKNGKWYFYVNGTAKTGWITYNGKWYYLNPTGAMQTGWVAYNGKWYYLMPSGEMRTGWSSVKGKWYFFDQTGAMKTGWLYSGSKWYYLAPSGEMKTGWVLVKNQWYFLDQSGAMKTGWLLSDGKWYYLASSGEMKTGWLDLAGKKYYLANSGSMVKGWLEMDGKWYYFSPNGLMAADTSINGYKLGPDGAWIQVEYVALGDSLAAGMTPDGQDRIPENGVDLDWGYPNYIAQDLAKTYQLLHFINYGVSGYKTDDVVADLGKDAVKEEIKKATHLTIDIGANDLLPQLPRLQSDPSQAPEVIAGVSEKIDTILSTIDQINPNVKVYVMGYYNPFPYITDPLQQAQMNQLLLAFNGQIQAKAIKNGDTFVPTSQVINVDNFVEYLPNPKNIHLSLPGYQVVAGEFLRVMQ